MLNPQQENFLRRAWQAAVNADHIFPEMAACEAALESGYGHSQLATQDNNLFGMKQHTHPIFGTHSLPTREFVGKEKDTADGICDGWIATSANWVSYPDWQACFADRMSTLRRLAPRLEHYAAALDAKSGEEYVREVSRTWSTDPERADKVLRIYNAIAGDWSATQN